MSVNVVVYIRTLKQGRSLDPSEPQFVGSLRTDAAEDKGRTNAHVSIALVPPGLILTSQPTGLRYVDCRPKSP
jgi:hypothetical protein